MPQIRMAQRNIRQTYFQQMEKYNKGSPGDGGLKFLNFNTSSHDKRGFRNGKESPNLQQFASVERPKKMPLNYDLMNNRI